MIDRRDDVSCKEHTNAPRRPPCDVETQIFSENKRPEAAVCGSRLFGCSSFSICVIFYL
jgi:hypothetical protein